MTKDVDQSLNPSPERRAKRRRHDDMALPNFQDMTDNAVQGILVHTNFRPLYANKAFAALFGYQDPKQITDLPLVRPLFPAQDWQTLEEEYDSFIHSNAPRRIDRMLGVHKDGHEIWLATTKRLIDWHGTPAVQICAFDISKQVEMERVMLANEQRLRAVLEILPVPVYIARRRDGRIQYVNRKTCLLLQQSTAPLLKASSDDFFVDLEDRNRIHELIDQLSDIREIDVRMKTAQGREFVAEIAAIKMDYAGEPALLVSMNDISQRKKLEEELFHQANTDALTGIHNRRFFMIQAEQEIRRAQRFSRSLSIIMMDLDHFKHINDTYGHAAGDCVLETVVHASLETLRESDIIGRLGGEEFAILLPETSLEAAIEVAGRLRIHIAETMAPTAKGAIQCTTSLGVTEMGPKDSTIDDLLSRADEALYSAKEKGRNRIEFIK
ncbi:MAG: diguanylate cyclase [Proteobacteria bacterium]|jgi:diguanylate cyclase (GGDEF)-like protein/PAS domain S-box-containing protein|nr:sensor domain-containing diguanylate cyclase [Alphaproteobacteria bacterium]NCC03851.1 diguanylate cyclase [Pseudomonadota bacterium]